MRAQSRRRGGRRPSALPPPAQRGLFPPQTFVNEVRIPDQKYITLRLNDVIRFGYDILSSLSSSGPPLVPKAIVARYPGSRQGPQWSQLGLEGGQDEPQLQPLPPAPQV